MQNDDFVMEQRKDPELAEPINLLDHGELPADDHRACRITLQKPMFVLENGMLFYIDPKQNHCRRAVVLQHLFSLHPIPVSRPFQIVGVDIIELPMTDKGNRCVLVFQTKWPLAFPMPDQKSQPVAEFLVKTSQIGVQTYCHTSCLTCVTYCVTYK